jgi:predicted MFS family arabinose efflux permease
VLATLRQRNFALLWTAGFVSLAGDWALWTLLQFYVYDRTGSTVASALMLVMSIAPAVLFGSVAGVFVDRWDRRRTMIVVNLLQTVLMPALILGGRDGWLWVVYVVAFLESTLAQFMSPAESALLPTLVAEDRLVTANALNQLNDNIARIVGPSIGGVLAATGGLTAVTLFDSASFLGAAALISLLVTPRAPKRVPTIGVEDETSAYLGVWREWREGLSAIRSSQLLRSLFAIAAVATFADTILSVSLAPFIKDVVDGGAASFGALLSVRGISGIIGGLVIARIGPRIVPARLVAGGLVAVGIAIAVMAAFPSLPLVYVLIVVVGPAIVGSITGQQTLLQEGTADRLRGRVFGAFGTSSAAMGIAGTILAGFLAEAIGIIPVLGTSAALYATAGLVAFALLSTKRRGVSVGASSE